MLPQPIVTLYLRPNDQAYNAHMSKVENCDLFDI